MTYFITTSAPHMICPKRTHSNINIKDQVIFVVGGFNHH